MNIKIVCVGSVKEEYYRNKIKEYVSKVNKYSNMTITELPDEPIKQQGSERIKELEGIRIIEKLSPRDFVVALCIEGDMNAGENIFRKLIKKASDKDCENIVFIIGGSLGLWEEVVKRADYKLSFSPMTFPHQLMRVMLLEQIASAVTYDK